MILLFFSYLEVVKLSILLVEDHSTLVCTLKRLGFRIKCDCMFSVLITQAPTSRQ